MIREVGGEIHGLAPCIETPELDTENFKKIIFM